MTVAGPPDDMQRLTIVLRSGERAHHHSLATEILARARRARLAGATLLEGVESHGRSGERHRHHLFTDQVPKSIIVVDRSANIAEFIAANQDVLEGVLVVVEAVTAFRA